MLFNEAEQILKNHKKNLTKLGANKLAIFGSIARNEGRLSSDVDILVDFDAKKRAFWFC